MSFLFKNLFTCKSHYLLIRWCYKTRFFLWNTNNIDRNGVNKQNSHSEKDNTGKGWYEKSDTPLFLKQPPILPTPPFLWEKSEPPFSKKRGGWVGGWGFQLCWLWTGKCLLGCSTDNSCIYWTSIHYLLHAEKLYFHLIAIQIIASVLF